VPKYAYLDKTTNAFAVFKSDDDDTKAEVFLPIMVAIWIISCVQVLTVQGLNIHFVKLYLCFAKSYLTLRLIIIFIFKFTSFFLV
jgi:hypothetical protein